MSFHFSGIRYEGEPRPADLHVLPLDDLREHREERDCWCRPRLETADDCRVTVVVHNSLDGRELIEQHGVN